MLPLGGGIKGGKVEGGAVRGGAARDRGVMVGGRRDGEWSRKLQPQKQ